MQIHLFTDTHPGLWWRDGNLRGTRGIQGKNELCGFRAKDREIASNILVLSTPSNVAYRRVSFFLYWLLSYRAKSEIVPVTPGDPSQTLGLGSHTTGDTFTGGQQTPSYAEIFLGHLSGGLQTWNVPWDFCKAEQRHQKRICIYWWTFTPPWWLTGTLSHLICNGGYFSNGHLRAANR